MDVAMDEEVAMKSLLFPLLCFIQIMAQPSKERNAQSYFCFIIPQPQV